MRVLLKELGYHSPQHVIIESYEGGIYQAYWRDGKTEHLIWLDEHTPLSCRNLTNMRQLLSDLDETALWLRQNSAYDEMIGQPQSAAANTLLIPLTTPLPWELSQSKIH
ncbi:hypothetical protein HBA55_05725 [Pseudomaricurvus alkylphenolicus]|jgi:hypothetical protein|uniref:DUF6482 family protein n=1 Tax=Pseudomaricurvus alkylphenolicus TaxID=1306991 RepID=UPI0014200DE0|nr:DUF6482 family protein [Pseudomaricurvus alkylphenolicus]NIB39075.1 hypothetical protein [Pseudomaricurvus alkylphenolicus]